MRVLDVAGGARLVEEPADDQRVVSHLSAQHLDGHAAPQSDVLRQVHGAHATTADLRLDDVVADTQADQVVVHSKLGSSALVDAEGGRGVVTGDAPS